MSGKKEKLKRRIEKLVDMGLRLGWTNEDIARVVGRLGGTPEVKK